ncbi:Stress responsive A/B Barrel Domain [Robiginitalea myxolifaciens]|uniref:Stress responsive A/B Barrel Domain n=1 Tax=Robiginitalea myxolifaciens TaxID=400055 RepID=A0A1I6HDC6_9FLAO|nr:Dabb family protein [Robiginitalea myxolifaciens]SFR52287.1 Stress responsive A/B Barrel Domain [Robiginitalea myxolifaciens]
MKTNILVLFAICLLASCGESNTNVKESEDPISADSDMTQTETKAPEKMLRHVVLFKFKDSSTPEDIQAVEAAFADLPNKIPEIVGFEWGTNNSPEGLDKGFTHCFFLTFESEAARDTYLPHPDHKAFGDIAGPHIEDVLVVDYWNN